MSLLSKVTQLADKLKEQEQSRTSQRTTKREYNPDGPRLETIFLDSETRKLEVRFVADSTGALEVPAYSHQMGTHPTVGKVTATCKRTQDKSCEICESVTKLDELGYGNAWKYRSRESIKVLVYVNRVLDPGITHIKPNTLYIAHVNRDTLTALVEAIQSNIEYYGEAAMEDYLNYTKPSSGLFIMTGSSKKVGRGTRVFHQFQWVPAQVPAINVTEFAGKESVNLKYEGIWNAGYVNDKKFQQALNIVTGTIQYMLDNPAEGNQGTASTASTETTPTPVNAPDATVANQPTEIPSTPPTNESVAHTESTNVSASTTEPAVESTASTGKPTCFGNFQPSQECISCPANIECIPVSNAAK